VKPREQGGLVKATLTIVPPGGGEAEYSLDFELPGAPQPCDYVTVSRPDRAGVESFVVRRSWWLLEHPARSPASPMGFREAVERSRGLPDGGDSSAPPSPPVGQVKSLMVECEIAEGPFPSEQHREVCQRYAAMGRLKKFETSAF
jgi:hypothetical protein